MALTVSVWPHLLRQVMAHLNAVNDALTSYKARINDGGIRTVTAAMNLLIDSDANGLVIAEHEDANTVRIPPGLAILPGQRIDVAQEHIGDTYVDVAPGAILNGGTAPVGVGGIHKVLTIYCIAVNKYITK